MLMIRSVMDMAPTFIVRKEKKIFNISGLGES